ncbi:hypothetical protein M0813_17821 [Anaeramoeba flamelloides]|uniref:Uncharacterized protein n=1 Tax=Anaeramoeba flamelloides TaxID=1746091 RepID=A0ABQ8YU55_9EUKA|nr:hypothetical protein M0813_17821 [Anaeramoeba flamelloides]
MKHLFLLFSLIFTLSVIYAAPLEGPFMPEASCSNRQYVGLGKQCNTSNSIYCYDNLFCENYFCAKDNTGETCTKNGDCYGNICVSGKCSNMKDCGDKCTDKTECWSETCTGGVCVGGAEGSTCDPSKFSGRQCDKGLFCSGATNKCTKQLGEGEDCLTPIKPNLVDFDIICAASFVCDFDPYDTTSGTCVRKFSKEGGQACKSSSVCEVGYGCQNSVCVEDPTTCNTDNKMYCPVGSHCLCAQSEDGLGAGDGTCSHPINHDCLFTNALVLMCSEINGCMAETNNAIGTCLYENCFDYLEENECCKRINHTDSYYVNKGLDCETCNIDISYAGLNGDCSSKRCYANLWCNSQDKCVKDNTGSDCTVGTDCYGGVCAKGKCSILKDNGDKCEVSDECRSGACTNGVCRGKAEGTTCDPMKIGGEDCDWGYFCDSLTSKCLRSIEPGMECMNHLAPYFMDWTDVCTAGYMCDHDDASFTTGTCKLVFGGEEGSTCGSSYTCPIGYGCVDFKCQDAHAACDISTKFCSYGQYCKCNDNHVSGNCVSYANQNCQGVGETLVNCGQFFSCPLGEEFAKGTCLYTYCYDYVRDFQCCLQDGYKDTYFPNEGFECETCAYIHKYVGPGETCGSGTGNLCYNNLWCNSNTEICERDNTGSDCTVGTDCYGGVCAKGTCATKLQAGDDCVVSDECWSGNCINSKCAGISFGKACDPSQNFSHVCGQGMYCDSQKLTCQFQLEEGQDCLSHIEPYYFQMDIVCRGGLICDFDYDLTAGVCMGIYSGQKNDNCSSSYICEMGLACQQGKCTDSFTKCDLVSKNCPIGYDCICDTDKIEGTCKQYSNTDCQAEASILTMCMEQHNCGLEMDFIKGTCAYENCFVELEYLECCRKNGYEGTFYVNNGISCKKCLLNYNWASVGQKCTDADTKCYPHLWCNQKSGLCELDNSGSACTTGTECYGGVCSDKKCTVMKANIDKCTTNDECWSGSCKNGVCRGNAPGVACDPSTLGGHTCDVGLYCDSITHTCSSQIKAGEECLTHLLPYLTDWASVCTHGYACQADDANYETGKCLRVFSGEEGDACSDSIACANGYACQDFKCTKTFDKCNLHNLHCPEGYYCNCNTNQEDGKCIQIANTDCQIYTEELVDCMDTHGCPVDIEIAEGTCIHDHCFEQSQRLECCRTEKGYDDKYYPNIGMECHNCVKNTYGKKGDACDLTHEKLCMKNLFCDSTTSKCALDNTGSTCTQGSECYGGICINGKCAVKRLAGDECEIDGECWNGNCLNNVCKGSSVGFVCDPSIIGGNQCDKNLFCDSITKECLPSKPQGSSCMKHLAPYYEDYVSVCEPATVCDPDDPYFDSGTCRRVYSGKEGDSCGSSIVCEVGYACVMNKCTKTIDACNDKTHLCPITHYCNCNADQTQGTCTQIANSACQEPAESFVNCLDDNLCKYPEQIGKGQCNYDKCLNQLNSFECCLQKGFTDSFYPHAGIDCENCPYIYNYKSIAESCTGSHDECYDNLFCNVNTGKCQLDNTGSSCQNSTQCYGGICINGICSIKKDSGSDCNVNEECWNENCQNSKCTGKTQGSSCDPSNFYGAECNQGLFCDSVTFKCIAQLQPGAECLTHITPFFTDWRLACVGGYYCDHVDDDFEKGYCKRLYSGQEGDTCGSSDTCQLGLACQNYKCTSSFSTCDQKSKFCPYGYNCECNSDKLDGKCVQVANTACQLEAEMLVDCMDYRQCPYEKKMTKGTCAHDKCNDYLRYFECCLQENNFHRSYYENTGIDCNTCASHKQFAHLGEYCNDYAELYCYPNLWCDTNDYSCKLDNTGAECTSGADCYGGVCANKVCSGKLAPGDSCKVDSQCLSLDCSNGVCAGKKKGATCDPISLEVQECDQGLFCDSITSVCIDQIKPDKECISHLLPFFSDWESACTPGYICSHVDETFEKGYCTKLYSGKEGENCGFSATCEMPLACQNYECTSVFYYCDEVTKLCPEGATCVCTSSELNGYCSYYANTDCQNEVSNYVDCQITNKCGITGHQIDGSCSYQHCFHEFSALQCCKQNSFETTYYLNKLIGCGTPTPTPTKGSDKIPDNNNNNVKLGVGIGIPLCIALIAVAFFMWPKKKKSKKGNYEAL